MTQHAQTLWTNARVATGEGVSTEVKGLDILSHKGRITAIGTGLARPAACQIVNCEGRLLTPSLIDCHTHLVFGGNRSAEFEARLNGASYAEIAASGGGIAATMRATRLASVGELVKQSLPRLDALLAEGVGTVEIKSGYGLSLDAELNLLRAARKLEQVRAVRIKTSWLAAHAIPPEYKSNRQGYIAEVVLAGLAQAQEQGLVDAVDGFCESLAFSPAEMDQIFAYASKLGLPVKLHAEQLSHQGGAVLAARHHALSADHLEWLAPEEANVLARSGTVAVLLPGAYYMLRETKLPPVAALRAAGVKIALSTDCNPGTSPMTSLLMAMNMGAVLFGLTVGECFYGATGAAAQALGLSDETGCLKVGASADLALWNVASLAELVNPIGFNPLHARYFKGQKVL